MFQDVHGIYIFYLIFFVSIKKCIAGLEPLTSSHKHGQQDRDCLALAIKVAWDFFFYVPLSTHFHSYVVTLTFG